MLFVSDLTVKCNCGGPDNAKQELKDNEKLYIDKYTEVCIDVLT